MSQYQLPFSIDAAARLKFFVESMGCTLPPKIAREASRICKRVTR